MAAISFFIPKLIKCHSNSRFGQCSVIEMFNTVNLMDSTVIMPNMSKSDCEVK